MVSLRSIFALAFVGLVHATPGPVSVKRQTTVTPLNSTQMNEFTPYTYLVGAAYCKPYTTINWSCGANCKAVPGFQPVASGGDGDAVQFWYVGYLPTAQTVIVAHQGTNPVKLLADLTDLNILLKPLDASLFPGIPSDVEAHSGFANEQARTASTILYHVKSTLSAQGLSQVTVVGHSLGGALALLDGVFFRLQLPGVTVNVISYGMPRVGNQAFANFVDSQLGGRVTHVNNRKDPVPIVPPISLGFHHPSGEIHIRDSGPWEACPGQDNPSDLCIVGDEKSILEGNLIDHLGPYSGIYLVCLNGLI